MSDTMTKEQVLQAYKYVRNIKSAIHRADEEYRKAQDAFNKAKRIYDGTISDLQQRCPHINTEYTPDASGNNDSSTDCLDCGKYLGH